MSGTRKGGNCHRLLRSLRRFPHLTWIYRAKGAKKRPSPPTSRTNELERLLREAGLDDGVDYSQPLGERVDLKADGSNWLLTKARKEVPDWL